MDSQERKTQLLLEESVGPQKKETTEDGVYEHGIEDGGDGDDADVRVIQS